MFNDREIKGIAVIEKCTAFALILGLAVAPFVNAAEIDVCAELQSGKVAGKTTPDPAVPTPNITAMPIQVYTTVDPDANIAGITPALTYRCAIASDLSEVDVMLEDAGFDGFDPSTVPVVQSAMISYLSTTADRNAIRAVAWAVIRGDKEADEWLAQMKANTDLYNPGALNVYYVEYDDEFLAYPGIAADETHPFEVKGMHLRDADGNTEKMIFYGNAATPSTLAHEFGHAFSNGHVNFFDLEGTEWCQKFLPHNKVSEEPGTFPEIDMECEFTRKNYMWAGSEDDRQFLGDPQADRMRNNEKSIIFQFQPSTTPTDCPDTSSNPQKNCKRLERL